MPFLSELTGGPRWLWGALGGGAVVGALGLLALWAGRGWLIPSLGPSILMQCYMPGSRESRLYHVVVGQGLGILAGALSLLVTGAQHSPGELAAGTVHPDQIIASILGLMGTLLSQVLLKAIHPPAASTALLLATGSFRLTPGDLLTMVTAVLIVGALGEPLRRWRALHVRALPPGPPSGGGE